MLQLKNVTLYQGKKCLLENANFTQYAGEKIGVVGSNGVGKTSLFKLITGDLETDKGECELPNDTRIAQIRQEVPYGNQTALEYVLEGDAHLAAILSDLAKAEAAEDGMAIADCHFRLSECDGYSAESKVAKIMLGLGFEQSDLKRTISDFSGGWRMRLNLAQVLMTPSDLMLLDEPTNHLDLEAIFWLENWLKHMKCTMLIISHDRDFLDNVIGKIIFIKDQTVHSFTGNYSYYEEQYALLLEQQQATYLKQQRQISHLTSFVDRFRAKASKATQAQSRLKMLDRIDRVSAVHIANPFNFQFKQPDKAGNPMITLRKASIGYDDKVILNNVNISIRPGDRLALLGKNGAGKSTLVKGLAQLNTVEGNAVYHPKVKIGYFTQHQIEALNLKNSAFSHVQVIAPGLAERDVRQFLGGFMFSNERIFEPVGNFSGGEKSRLALALLVWQRPNVLLLDEPTNHLDLEMRQALMLALQNFEGALILVAHDQYLLSNLTDEFYLIKNGTVQPFEGDLKDYQNLSGDD